MQELWHRRHAIQIVAQLPEVVEDAILVLEAARELVEGFLTDQRRARPSAELVAFPSASASALAASSSARSVPGSPSILPK